MAKNKIPPGTRSSGKSRKVIEHRRVAKPKADTGLSPIETLRRTIEDIRARLEGDAKAHGTRIKSRGEVRKTRYTAIDTLSKRMETVSGQLKQGLQNAERRDEARRLALAKIAELRAQLHRGHD